MITITQRQADRMVVDLTRIGVRLEAVNRREWLTVARAAAMIEAIRLQRTTGPQMAVKIGEIVPGLEQIANECGTLDAHDVLTLYRAALILRAIALGEADIELSREACHA